jgi:hypothetical protein
MIRFAIAFSFIYCSVYISSYSQQDIASHFGFSMERNAPNFKFDNLSVCLGYSNKKNARANTPTFYSLINGQKKDSLSFKKSEDVQDLRGGVIRGENIFCLISYPQRVVEVNKQSGKIISSKTLPDSILFEYRNQWAGAVLR